MEHIVRILERRQKTRLLTIPTNELHKWCPNIDHDIINPDPERWWSGTNGGTAREAARWVARQPVILERLTPDANEPPRLLFMDAQKRNSREGTLSRYIQLKHDMASEAGLAAHPVLGIYFGQATHPATWEVIRDTPHRSLIIKARAGTLPVGENLVKWGFNQRGDRETQCMCNWDKDDAEYETIEHLLFHCPLSDNVAAYLRNPEIPIHQALGHLEEIIVTPAEPNALKIAKVKQLMCITAMVNTWEDRKARRLVALHPN